MREAQGQAGPYRPHQDEGDVEAPPERKKHLGQPSYNSLCCAAITYTCCMSVLLVVPSIVQ